MLDERSYMQYMRNDSLPQSVAVETIRQWHLTICHDLCLPVIPVIVKQNGNGFAGRFFGEWRRDPTTFSAVTINGFTFGGSSGGETHVSYHVEIYVTEGYTSQEYLYTLAHELRHAWQFLNNIAPTEEDCENYAARFWSRFQAPTLGRYGGLVDAKEYEAAKKRDEARKKEENEGCAAVIILAIIVIAAILIFSWVHNIYSS